MALCDTLCQSVIPKANSFTITLLSLERQNASGRPRTHSDTTTYTALEALSHPPFVAGKRPNVLDRDTMTNIALEAIASAKGKKQKEAEMSKKNKAVIKAKFNSASANALRVVSVSRERMGARQKTFKSNKNRTENDQQLKIKYEKISEEKT